MTATLGLAVLGYSVVVTGDALKTSGSQEIFSFPEITATTAELNALDGVTATYLELNALDASSATAITAGHTNVTFSVKQVDVLNTDTTVSRASAGDLAVEGNRIFRVGGADVPVADGGTGLSAGTSGGILAYTATGTLASSGLLTQYGPLIGGGAGVAPSAITAGTDNQVLRGATGAAPAFGALVDADIPNTITISNATGSMVSSNLLLTGSQTTSSGVGAVVTARGSVVEEGNSVMHKTTITITNGAIIATLADADHGAGVVLYDFPAGVIAIHGVTCNMVVTNSAAFEASDNDHYFVGVGTVIAADDATLATTEQNLIAVINEDTAAGVTLTHTEQTFLATTVIVDGSSTACDVALNFAVAGNQVSGSNNFGVQDGATITITWSNLGDPTP